MKTGMAAASALVIPSDALALFDSGGSVVRLSVISDLHGGFAVDAMSRLDTFLESISRHDCQALIQLGDFAYPNAKHAEFADKFNGAHDQTIHVIGNHEFDHGLKRSDCYRVWGMDTSYYRRDLGSLRILVLDGNESGSPTHRGGYPSFIGKKQQAWLDRELNDSKKPVLILSHQPLAGTIAIDNATELQTLLTKYQTKIVACLNGHSHVDALVQVGGVSYLHINSASYYWVGGNTRMAYYSKPLFTTVTIDPEAATVSIAPSKADWKDKSPEEIGYFDGTNRPPSETVTPQIRNRILPMKLRL